MRHVTAVAVLLVTGYGAAVHTQAPTAPPAPRTYLLFVDDLHLDFRQTPRTRALMQRLIRALWREGDSWAVVSTGTSSVSVPPTTDRATLDGAVSRVTGNGLKPSERIVPAPLANSGAELQRRAAVAYATAADAIGGLAAAPTAITVLYVSEGYDVRAVSGPSAVIDAAARARATIYAFDPRELIALPAPNIPPDGWDSYLAATRETLRALAAETGGLPVFALDDVDDVLARLATGAR